MKRILIACLMLVSINVFSQNDGREMFNLINEYRTDVLNVAPLEYNESLQAESDSIARLSSKRWYQYKASVDGVILSSKDYQDILTESISGSDNLQMSEKAVSASISFYRKNKNIYCVMLIEVKSPDSKGDL